MSAGHDQHEPVGAEGHGHETREVGVVGCDTDFRQPFGTALRAADIDTRIIGFDSAATNDARAAASAAETFVLDAQKKFIS